MLGLAFTVFACPHRLAVDGDVTRVPAFLEKQGSQNIGQSLRVDDAQGFGQRRMTRCRPAYKAEFRLLTPAQAPPKKKGRLHSAPPTQERYDDQAQDRPQHVVLPLLAARVRNLPQNRFQLQCRGLLESGSLLNQNTRSRSICSVRSIDCPAGSITKCNTFLAGCCDGNQLRAFDGRGAGDPDGDAGGWLQSARRCSLPWSQSVHH